MLPYNFRKIVSEGLFTSTLGYCLPVFGGCKVEDLKDLQILQNKVAQIVTHSSPRTVRNKMFDQLDWLTVNQLVRYHTLLAIFRIRTTREPEYLASGLCDDNRSGNIIVQKSNLTLFRNSFMYRGPSHWNALPARIKQLTKVGVFKREVKTWIKNNIARFLD